MALQLITTPNFLQSPIGTGGLPASTPYLLLSYWGCLSASQAMGFGTGPAPTVQSFSLTPTALAVVLQNTAVFQGHFAISPSIAGVLANVLVSINTATSTIQVYVNDQPMSLTSGGWATPAPLTFNASVGSWSATDAGSFPAGPGLGDLWIGAPASFYDLSVVANRRKFINANYSPVSLAPSGSGPLGVPPAIFMSVPSGSVTASDFLTNRGSGPGPWVNHGAALAIDPPGTCSTLFPPAPPPRLAIDNVTVTATATLLEKNLISLRWSDDRGHSWGSPVTQDIGEAGEYRTSLQWQRLAYARDRVFELSWSVPMRTALQGCWIDVTPAQS